MRRNCTARSDPQLTRLNIPQLSKLSFQSVYSCLNADTLVFSCCKALIGCVDDLFSMSLDLLRLLLCSNDCLLSLCLDLLCLLLGSGHRLCGLVLDTNHNLFSIRLNLMCLMLGS